MNSTVKGWVEDASNPQWALPGKVLFPAVAGDVVAAVAFAKEHGLEVSVKNSGHSYINSSSKGNTLLINMNKFEPYAAETGAVGCSGAPEGSSLAEQPCRLSLAKGKPGYIRTGGGENWGEVYGEIRQVEFKTTWRQTQISTSLCRCRKSLERGGRFLQVSHRRWRGRHGFAIGLGAFGRPFGERSR